MAAITLPVGFVRVAWLAPTLTLAQATWKNNVDAIFRENPARSTFVSFKPANGINSVTTVVQGEFYFFKVKTSFSLDDTIISLAATTGQPIVPAPTITSFTPASGQTGTSVTIAGTGFTGAYAVVFNNVVASTFSVSSATSITATVPTLAASGPVKVFTAGGVATGGAFAVAALPVPAAPAWTFNSQTRILSLAAPSGYTSSPLEYSYQNAPYQDYAAGLSVDGLAHAAGEWRGRVKASSANQAGTVADSPQILAVAQNNTFTYTLPLTLS